MRGRYTPGCCPEYLKAGLVERIRVHGSTVTDFLRTSDEPISRFVLLDHMDRMSCYHPAALVEEWAWILRRATRDARIIFRSAHAAPVSRAVRQPRGPHPARPV